MSPIDLLVATPLAFMICAILAGNRAGWLILAILPLMAGLSVWLVLLPHDAAHVVGGWELPLGIMLRADGIARLMVPAATLCFLAVGLYTRSEHLPGSGGGSARSQAFWPMMYLMWAGTNAGFLTTDLFNLYVAIEMVSLAAVAMAALGSPQAALRYFLIALVGSLAYLMGVALLFANYDTVDITLLAGIGRPDLATRFALGVMTAGLLIKTALFPLHGWLPPAHAAAPAPASALLSAIVVKLGFVILVRLWFEAFPQIAGFSVMHLLGGMGALAVLYGSVQAMRQDRLKPLVAYSTVAQIGYLFLAFPLVAGAQDPSGAWAGMMLHGVAHMLAKAAMFLAAGLMLKAAHGDRIADLGGLARTRPITVTAFGLAAVSLMGLPLSGGFTAKFLLLHAAIEQGAVIYAAILVIGGLMAAIYLFQPLAMAISGSDMPAGEAREPLRAAAPFALAVIAIALGFAGSAAVDLSVVAAPWATEAPSPPEASK